MCVHGFPTSSIDFYALTDELGAEFDIFTLDFPGYGLSDKPPEPYVYSLYDDARLLVHAITEVWKLTDYRSHPRSRKQRRDDRPEHPRLEPSGCCARRRRDDERQHLPTVVQPHRLPDRAARRRDRPRHCGCHDAGDVGGGLGASTFMPRRNLDDPEIAALAKCFAHNDGIRVLPDTIRYLHERAADETRWLEELSESETNLTLVWGVHDTVAPLRVPNHVWQRM